MLTYPPTYLCYWLADRIFGDPYLTIELFIILHLAAGYFVTFWVLRRFGLRPSLSAAGSLSFTLCAFFLIAGRSQATFVPGAVWLPLIVGSVLTLERGPVGWKWALGTGAVVGIYYHAGHAQFWVYSLMFFAAAVGLLLVSGRIPWRRALWCVPALSFGLALAAPLLIPQMAELKGRHFGAGGTGVNLLGMLIPLGRWAPDIRQPLSQQEWGGETPYFGTTFAVAGFAALAYYFYLLVLCKLKPPELRARLGDARWLLLMLLATLMALGPDGILWPLMSNIPPFHDFRWPNKLLPFVALFACVGGGMELERWCSRRPSSRAQWLAAATMALVALNAWWAQACWYHFGDRPYPKLNTSYAALILPRNGADDGRILTRPQWEARSPAQGFFRTQALNFPTVTGALSLGGYDTFIEASKENRRLLRHLYSDPVATAQSYGVRWVIWDKLNSETAFSPNPLVAEFEMVSILERRALLSTIQHSSPALLTDNDQVYRLASPDPLAFIDGADKKSLPVHFNMEGAVVDTASVPTGSSVVVNVLSRPWTKAFADGSPAPSKADGWGRVVVPLTNTTHTLEVLYCPPWGMSCLAGLGIAVVGWLCGWVLKRLPETA
jgi:hypothetical protein